jgi:hypothetical protein
LLAVMSILALGALLLSVSTSEKISSFPSPTPGDPAVVSIFRTVVQRTLHAPSFTYAGFLNYQAPDRTETTLGSSSGTGVGGGLIIIGNEVYTTPLAIAGKWGKGPLSSTVSQDYGPHRVRITLETLLKARSVIRDGDHFVVTQVLPADLTGPENPGQILVTSTVYVSDDYVTTIKALVQGWATIQTAFTNGHYVYRRVASFEAGPETFANFAHVPPINAPPTSKTIELYTCGGSHVLHVAEYVPLCE